MLINLLCSRLEAERIARIGQAIKLGGQQIGYEQETIMRLTRPHRFRIPTTIDRGRAFIVRLDVPSDIFRIGERTRPIQMLSRLRALFLPGPAGARIENLVQVAEFGSSRQL